MQRFRTFPRLRNVSCARNMQQYRKLKLRSCVFVYSSLERSIIPSKSIQYSYHQHQYSSFTNTSSQYPSSYSHNGNAVYTNEMAEFLNRKKLVVKVTDSHYIVRDCPFCHSTHGKMDNLFKLYINKAKGVYMCHRCGVSGHWIDFKRRLTSNVALTSATNMLHDISSTPIAHEKEEIKVIQILNDEKAQSIQENLIQNEEFASVRTYLIKQRGLQMEIVQKYGVGAVEQPFWKDEVKEIVPCITFPWTARDEDLSAMGVVRETTESTSNEISHDKNQFQVIRLKIRGLQDKSQQRIVPKGGSWGVFGWNTIPLAAEEIIVTEGEFDAMAVHQSTGLPAVSLPNGCTSLPPSILPLFNRFKKIYLWMDNDAPGQGMVEKFAWKLGQSRTFIVRLPSTVGSHIKDANDALLHGLNMKEIIANAERIPHNQITTFEEMRRQVKDEIMHPLRGRGYQSRTLPSLNRFLKGHRMGELTILTGPTGCGKTTLLSQLSIDYCNQGVSTLWGSFEIKNTRLMQKMLTQYIGKDLYGDEEVFNRAADGFEKLPMYFLRFFGSTDVDEVLDAMDYAVYAYDVQHVLLDNVQFMMAGQGRGFDKFERQDAALDKFRRFATSKNVHLTLVIHPRKEQEDTDLTLTSVFGSGKATQEADNVLILQNCRGKSKLDIRKNRFDGTLGSIPLTFNRETICLKEVHDFPMSDEASSMSIELEMDMLQKRKQQDPAKNTLMPDVSVVPRKQDMSVHIDNDNPINTEKRHVNGSNNVINGYKEPFSKFTPLHTF